jgi:uncharacterized protein YecE (DUF72 family)
MTLTRLGCAGWSISREAAPSFDGPGSHLQRYAAVLNAVEINSSFYRPHQPQTYARWADSVPEEFRFSVKLPRSITHEKRLQDSGALLDQFVAEAGTLGKKLGCVLVQLPPSLALEAAVAADFLDRLRDRFDCMLACEARHGSWFSDAASALLQSRRVIRVIADPPAGQPGPYLPTTDDSYIRLHGSPRMYYSSYAEEYLASVAAWLAARAGHQHWCIFDNTAAGAALLNAVQLRQLQAPPQA